MGIEVSIDISCLEQLRRPRETWGETFHNDVSSEGSPYGEEVLQKRVESGFAKKASSLSEAKRLLGGAQ